MVPGIHSPVPIQATSSKRHNTLSAAELQIITMVVMQVQSMAAATAAVAPTVAPFNFNGSDCTCMTTIVMICNSAEESVLCVCVLVACISAGEWMSWLREGTVQASRTKKYAATAIILPSTLHTTNIIKWARQQLAFRVPGIHSPAPRQATSPKTHNTLSPVELQKITMLVMQVKSMVAATAAVSPTVAPFTFNEIDFFRMLGWCGLKPTQEILIPPVWRQLKAETTNTGKKAVLAHLLDPSNVVDE